MKKIQAKRTILNKSSKVSTRKEYNIKNTNTGHNSKNKKYHKQG